MHRAANTCADAATELLVDALSRDHAEARFSWRSACGAHKPYVICWWRCDVTAKGVKAASSNLKKLNRFSPLKRPN
jgi:hypothetical protein